MLAAGVDGSQAVLAKPEVLAVALMLLLLLPVLLS